jgi:hypothetical protein
MPLKGFHRAARVGILGSRVEINTKVEWQQIDAATQ